MVTGKIAPWTGRFYTLLDPSYAKNHIPIIASVSEHQPTSWSSFYFDLQSLVFLFPTGLYFCFSRLSDANIFLILYGVTSIYFAVSKTVLIYFLRKYKIHSIPSLKVVQKIETFLQIVLYCDMKNGMFIDNEKGKLYMDC